MEKLPASTKLPSQTVEVKRSKELTLSRTRWRKSGNATSPSRVK